MKIHNDEAFFKAIRNITGKLSQDQVDTINGLLSAASHWPIGWLAYGFATAWHEARLFPSHDRGLLTKHLRPGSVLNLEHQPHSEQAAEDAGPRHQLDHQRSLTFAEVGSGRPAVKDVVEPATQFGEKPPHFHPP